MLISPRHVRFTPNNGRWAAHPSQHLAVGYEYTPLDFLDSKQRPKRPRLFGGLTLALRIHASNSPRAAGERSLRIPSTDETTPRSGDIIRIYIREKKLTPS
jgi:hypothetical protein